MAHGQTVLDELWVEKKVSQALFLDFKIIYEYWQVFLESWKCNVIISGINLLEMNPHKQIAVFLQPLTEKD